MPREEDSTDGGDYHLYFGKALGIGVQEFLTTENMNRAVLSMMLAWKGILDDEAGNRDKKNFWFAVHGLGKFATLRLVEFGNYNIAILNGRPATELSFRINLGDGFYYRGSIDAVLLNKMRGELLVIENKTTKFTKVHEAMFKNSGQALGYGLIIDAITHILKLKETSSYRVVYPVYMTGNMEWTTLPFSKNFTSRALWIKNILDDKATVIRHAEEGYFPMYGESCYEFFRPCSYFGTCEYSNSILLGGKEVVERKEEATKYDFEFTIEELIETQIAKGR